MLLCDTTRSTAWWRTVTSWLNFARQGATRPPSSWDLAERSNAPGAMISRPYRGPPDGSNTAVCLLDRGTGTPLIADCAIVGTGGLPTPTNPAWGTDDTAAWQGHGTRMAGVAGYGDLVSVLIGNQPVSPTYRLESVRILPPAAGPANDPDLYGAITGEAIARAEIQAPRRRRVVAMAVTSRSPSRGRPSSWPAAVDQLCFEEAAQRLRDPLRGKHPNGSDASSDPSGPQ